MGTGLVVATSLGVAGLLGYGTHRVMKDRIEDVAPVGTKQHDKDVQLNAIISYGGGGIAFAAGMSLAVGSSGNPFGVGLGFALAGIGFGLVSQARHVGLDQLTTKWTSQLDGALSGT